MLKAIVVSPEWLKACGMSHMEGHEFIVENERNFHQLGVFYKVYMTDGRTWEVWDTRGVTIVENAGEPVTLINRKSLEEIVVRVARGTDMSKDFAAYADDMSFLVKRDAYYVGHDEMETLRNAKRTERRLDGFQGHPNGSLIDNMVRCWNKLQRRVSIATMEGRMHRADLLDYIDGLDNAYDLRNAKLYGHNDYATATIYAN